MRRVCSIKGIEVIDDKSFENTKQIIQLLLCQQNQVRMVGKRLIRLRFLKSRSSYMDAFNEQYQIEIQYSATEDRES